MFFENAVLGSGDVERARRSDVRTVRSCHYAVTMSLCTTEHQMFAYDSYIASAESFGQFPAETQY